MNIALKAHHEEMDCLRKKAEDFQRLYECEKSQREKLEKALKDCEERKEVMFRQQQKQTRVMMQQQQRQPSSPPQHLTPCSDILSKFSSDRNEYTQVRPQKRQQRSTVS
jgi:predicted ribosome quality control (RQC) complex YloA/Tae2 family protein